MKLTKFIMTYNQQKKKRDNGELTFIKCLTLVVSRLLLPNLDIIEKKC